MLRTYLTTAWQLRYPIIGAPMAYVGRGRLARAITQAGGLGILGIGSTTPLAFIERECAICRADDNLRFGIGLMAWSLAQRPELLEAAIRERPAVVALSFGALERYVPILHAHAILVATQVHSRQEAQAAAAAGVDLIVAQGSEAGGHTGQVATLPLLQ